MDSAPIAKLKASLSRYLAGVKAGRELIITERGKPIAKIVPIQACGQDEEQRLREMEVRGLIRLGGGKLPRRFWEDARPGDPSGAVREALLKEREQSR